MDLYNCKVNLNSKSETQVFLPGVTAAEILILRAIHSDPTHEDVGGMESVVDIKKVGEADYTDEEEKERLTGAGADGMGVARYRLDIYRKVFPNDHIQLPQKLKEFDAKPKSKVSAKDDLAAVLT